MKLFEEFKLYENMWDDEQTFYITYQDSYGDSFTPYYITIYEGLSINQWPKDIRHYKSLDPDDKTYLFRASVTVNQKEADILAKVGGMSSYGKAAVKYKDSWIEAEKLLRQLVKTNRVTIIDDAADY